jgi:hypothetical protein
MCRKISCNRNVRNRVNKADFKRIVLNFIFYFVSKTKILGTQIQKTRPRSNPIRMFKTLNLNIEIKLLLLS